jgi:CHAT domain-containing protein
LASLWKVDDAATAALMNQFYRGWTGAVTKAEALKQAQLGILADQKKEHPYYWAAFSLIGNWL